MSFNVSKDDMQQLQSQADVNQVDAESESELEYDELQDVSDSTATTQRRSQIPPRLPPKNVPSLTPYYQSDDDEIEIGSPAKWKEGAVQRENVENSRREMRY